MWRSKSNVRRLYRRVTPALAFLLSSSFLTVVSSPAAHAITAVTATGTNAAICNQSGSDLGSSTSDVTAVRLSGGDCLVQFLTVKSGYQWNRPIGVSAFKVLIVGGGGGGGAGGSHSGDCSATGGREGGGGGGGGGGQAIETSVSVASPTLISIAVGGGGSGGSQGSCGAAGGSGTTGSSSSFIGVSASGGNGGGGGTSDGAGGTGGSTLNSSGTTLNGSTRLGSSDCPSTTTTGCFAAGGGAGATASATALTDAGTSTNGGNGGSGYTPSQVSVSGAFGGGGGGGNRHTASPPLATRSGGTAGSSNGGAGNCCGDGTAANANTGGGGGGGRGNGAANPYSVNSGVGGAGGSGLVSVQYTPVFNAAINKPSISGALNKGITASVTVNVEAAGVVRFYFLGKRIPNCLSVATSGTYPNITATCSWKPAVIGQIPITAVLTPTNSTLGQTQSQALTTIVYVRQNTR